MRRADRLFQIIQLLRNHRVTTAARLAESLDVSERTVYRDIGDLVSSGVPIEGERGVGYVMRKGFDLPPLMFTALELQALLLGSRVVMSWTDGPLARAAGDALQRIEAVLPENLRQGMPADAALRTRLHDQAGEEGVLRAAASGGRREAQGLPGLRRRQWAELEPHVSGHWRCRSGAGPGR